MNFYAIRVGGYTEIYQASNSIEKMIQNIYPLPKIKAQAMIIPGPWAKPQAKVPVKMSIREKAIINFLPVMSERPDRKKPPTVVPGKVIFCTSLVWVINNGKSLFVFNTLFRYD